MDFSYDSEHDALRAAVRELLQKTYGSTEDRLEATRTDQGWSSDAWARFAEMGLLGLPYPEEDGGVGAGPVEVAIVAEELGRVVAPEPFVETVVLAGGLVQELGDGGQRAAILGGIAAGELIVAFAHAEVGGRYEVQPRAVEASRSGDLWTLSGSKEPVLAGARADLFVVTAALPEDGGTGVFVVSGSASGLARSGYRTFDGGRAAKITFDATPATPLGIGGDATTALEQVVARGHVAYAHESLGAMEAALTSTVDYLKVRKQFGVPLMSFQALVFRAADMYVSVELARSIVMWATLVLLDSDDTDLKLDAAARAKLAISTRGRHVGQEAIQLHGGIGITAEYSVAHCAARLTAIDHLLGDGAHHLATLAPTVADYGTYDPIPD